MKLKTTINFVLKINVQKGGSRRLEEVKMVNVTMMMELKSMWAVIRRWSNARKRAPLTLDALLLILVVVIAI